MSLHVHLCVTVSQFLASNVRMYDNGSLRACLHGRGLPGGEGGGGNPPVHTISQINLIAFTC